MFLSFDPPSNRTVECLWRREQSGNEGWFSPIKVLDHGHNASMCSMWVTTPCHTPNCPLACTTGFSQLGLKHWIRTQFWH